MQFNLLQNFYLGEVFVINYEVNDETLAIIPEKTGTRILEINDEYKVIDSPYMIMENSCKYFGSSLDGRINGSKDILGSIYKVPIMVEETQKLIFFPTEALNSPKVSWISYRNIKNIEKYGKRSLIRFVNGKTIILNCPYFTMKNQIFRCNMLDSISSNRRVTKKTINL